VINADQIVELFPFSVQLDSDGVIRRVGRTLQRRLPDYLGRRIDEVFDVRRWTDTPIDGSAHDWIDRPLQLRIKGDPLLLVGTFSEVGGGLLFLGGPRLSHVEELGPLDLSIDDFASHDGVMTYLVLLQQMRAASSEAAAAANELAARARGYRQIVEQSNDLILSLGADGEVLFANPEACRLLPIVAGETVFSALLSGGQDGAWAECLTMLSEGGASVWVELALRGRSDGQVLVEGPLVRSAAAEEPDVLLAFFRDVSERKRAQSELARSTEQLRRSQKMEAIGRFAGGIAHDFNNLLGVVMGAGGMLKDDLPDGDPRLKDVDLILASAEKGSALARRLLMFSKKQPAAASETDLVACTRSLMQILTRVLGTGTSLKFEPDASKVVVAIEPGQFEQVLMNLVVNARDAMSDGGQILLRISVLPEGEGALVEVSDQGEGMTEDVLQKAFEPFFTTKPTDKGTGLGLSVVYGIISDAGGEIDVTSSPGHGTTFSIRMPTKLHSSSPAGAEVVSDDVAIQQKAFAVLLEDQDDLRRLTSRGLSGIGFDVQAFRSIRECRAGMRGLERKVDLFVTDVMLGDGNGLDLAEELASEGVLGPVIVITGHASLGRIDDLIARFGWRLLMKPFTMRQLQLVAAQFSPARSDTG